MRVSVCVCIDLIYVRRHRMLVVCMMVKGEGGGGGGGSVRMLDLSGWQSVFVCEDELISQPFVPLTVALARPLPSHHPHCRRTRPFHLCIHMRVCVRVCLRVFVLYFIAMLHTHTHTQCASFSVLHTRTRAHTLTLTHSRTFDCFIIVISNTCVLFSLHVFLLRLYMYGWFVWTLLCCALA